MQNQIILALLIGAVIGGAGVVLYQGSVGFMHGDERHEADINRSGMIMLPEGRGSHMEGMQQMFVTSERAFIEHMIPHHQEAIDTATEVLERGGTTEEIRVLMNDIITAQTAEIESMQTWYEIWYGESYADAGEYEPMMRTLENLSGESLDKTFLEDMIMHHMGAIMMARSVQPYVEHDEIAELTQNIVASQSAEIVQMRQMLQGL